MARKEVGTPSTPNTLLYDINTSLADNNAGLISARDVRENMANIAESIPYIVASGDWESVGTQFISNLYLKTTVDTVSNTVEGGVIIVESGIQFQNDIAGGELQVHAYPGPTGISHNDLADLAANDDHPQYLNINGVRNMGANLGLGTNWINNDGISTSSGHGLQFEQVSASEEIIHVGEDSYVKFDSDASDIKTGKSTAMAWVSFNSVDGGTESTTVTVNSSYNISMIERVQENGQPVAGKFKIYFKPGLFDSADTTGANICAIGTSNARQSNASGGDFDQNTVSCVVRNSDYVTYYVQDDTNAFRDAEVNDLMVFGVASGVTPESSVLVRYAT